MMQICISAIKFSGSRGQKEKGMKIKKRYNVIQDKWDFSDNRNSKVQYASICLYQHFKNRLSLSKLP